MSGQDFQTLYDAASAAGQAAAAASVPAPMYIKGYAPVMDGVCGFAWVKVKPATSQFARWLKKQGIVRSVAYGGGYDLWIGDYNQSMTRKEAHARAMAKVLRDGGINAYAGSRMD